jgi:hypothetical protein
MALCQLGVDDRTPERAHGEEQVRPRLRQLDADRVLVQDLHIVRLDLGEAVVEARDAPKREAALERPLDVGGGELIPGVARPALAQREGVGLAAVGDLPAPGHARLGDLLEVLGLPGEVEAALLVGRWDLLPAGQAVVEVEDVVVHLPAEHELPVETGRGRRRRHEQLLGAGCCTAAIAATPEQRSPNGAATTTAAADFRNDLRVTGPRRPLLGGRLVSIRRSRPCARDASAHRTERAESSGSPRKG